MLFKQQSILNSNKVSTITGLRRIEESLVPKKQKTIASATDPHDKNKENVCETKVEVKKNAELQGQKKRNLVYDSEIAYDRILHNISESKNLLEAHKNDVQDRDLESIVQCSQALLDKVKILQNNVKHNNKKVKVDPPSERWSSLRMGWEFLTTAHVDDFFYFCNILQMHCYILNNRFLLSIHNKFKILVIEVQVVIRVFFISRGRVGKPFTYL